MFNAAGVQVAYNPSYTPSIGSAAGFEVGTGQNEIPLNSDLGSASTVDTGTGEDEIPLNSDLGTASTKDTGTTTGNVLLSESAGLDNGETNWTSGKRADQCIKRASSSKKNAKFVGGHDY